MPSFPRVDEEPLSAVPDNAIVLYEGWRMKESAIIGNDGRRISLPGYKTGNWYPTTVPTTVLGTLVRNGVYPDPYISKSDTFRTYAWQPSHPVGRFEQDD